MAARYFLEAGVVLVPPRVAAVLVREAGVERWWRQLDVRGQDGQVDEVVLSLLAASAAWRGRGSGEVPTSVPGGSEGSHSERDEEESALLTVDEVVARNMAAGGPPLGARAVRKAALDGRLAGRHDGCRWGFSAAAIDRFLTDRNQPKEHPE